MERRNNQTYPGSTILIVLFFLFVCVFFDHSDASVGKESTFQSASSISHALALNDAQQIPVQKVAIRILVRSNDKIFGDGTITIAENRAVYHQVLFLQKTELLEKPGVFLRFHFYYHSVDTDDLPLLS